MRDFMYLGSAPYGEDCASVGQDDYHKRARAECRAYIGQLKRMFGDPPDGCSLVIRSNPHDFGSYLSVDAVFSDEAGAAYALKCENDQPELWDADARAELGLEVSDAAS
jgi:hypothetical protein